MDGSDSLDVWQAAEALRHVDGPGAGALYLQAREMLEREGATKSAGACTLTMAKMAADDFDLETAHHLALLAADALVTEPTAQHAAYMLAGRAALASDAIEAARGCFLAARSGTCGFQALEALACLELEAGDLNLAERYLHEAWARLPPDISPLAVASLRERFGELALQRRDFQAAANAYRCAIDSVRNEVSAEARLLAARLRTELGDLYAACGERERCLRSYQSALDYYLEVGLDRRALRVEHRIEAVL